MKTIQFDIERAKAGAKVVTRDGKPVRILCYDLKCVKPIVAAICVGNSEVIGNFNSNGSYYHNPKTTSDIDLMLQIDKPFKSKDENQEYLIVGKELCRAHGLLFFVGARSSYSPASLLDEFTFLDGSPCGVLED